MFRSKFLSGGLAAGLLVVQWGAVAGTATVDGSGGVATLEPTFPTSYATLGAALTAVNGAAGDHVINITTNGPLDEAAGLAFNQDKSITVNGATGGTHLRITPSAVGAGGGSVAVSLSVFTNRTIELNRLIITPSTGVAGIVSARAVQVWNSSNSAITATVNLNDVMVTALRPTGHANAGQALTDPFTQYESTIANRRANFRSFNGGGATSVYEINNTNANSGGLVTVNMVRSGACHIIHNVSTSAVGGGFVQNRTLGIAVNILEGCYFTFCDIAGVRTSAFGTSPANASFKMDGTPTNPVILYRNGWFEDAASTGRNEGALIGVGSTGVALAPNVIIDNVMAVQNYQEGLEIGTGTPAVVSNTILAENQYDLDTSNGTPPNAAAGANLLFQGASTVTVNDSTLYNNVGNTANDNAIRWVTIAGAALNTNRVIIAGAGDQVSFATGTRTWTDADTAVVTAGPDAMDATPVLLNGNTRTSTFPISADPEFASTTFTPTFTYGTGNSVPTSYLAVRSTAYRSTRTAGAADVKGANQNSPLPIGVSGFSIE